MNVLAVEVNRSRTSSRKKAYKKTVSASDKRKSEERRSMIKQILDESSDDLTKYTSSDDDDDDFVTRHLASDFPTSMTSGGRSPHFNARKGPRKAATPTLTARKVFQSNTRKSDIPEAPPSEPAPDFAPPTSETTRKMSAPRRSRSGRGDLPLLNSQIPYSDNSSHHTRHSVQDILGESLALASKPTAPPPPPPPPQDDSIDMSQVSRKCSIKSRRRSCRGDIVIDNLYLSDDASESLNSWWSAGGSTSTGGGKSRDSGISSCRTGGTKAQSSTSGPPTHIVPRRRLSSRGDIVMERVSAHERSIPVDDPVVRRPLRRIRSMGPAQPTKPHSHQNEKSQGRSDHVVRAPPRKSYSLGHSPFDACSKPQQPMMSHSLQDEKSPGRSSSLVRAPPRKSYSWGHKPSKTSSKLQPRLSTGLSRRSSVSESSEKTEETTSMSSSRVHNSPSHLRRTSHSVEPSPEPLSKEQERWKQAMYPSSLNRAVSDESIDSHLVESPKKSSKSRFRRKHKKDKKTKKKDKTCNTTTKEAMAETIQVHQAPAMPERTRSVSFDWTSDDDDEEDEDDERSTRSGVRSILELGATGLSALEKVYYDFAA